MRWLTTGKVKTEASKRFPLVRVTSAKKVVLHEDISVELDGKRLDFRSGAEFDGDSIPQIVWWVSPPINEGLLASMAHDKLYLEKGNRLRNDQVYFHLSIYCGTKKYKAYIKFIMLRLFGWIPYLTYR